MKHLPRVRVVLSFLLLSLLTACAAGPDYKRPEAPKQTRYTQTPLPTTLAAGDETQYLNPGGALPERWWKLFNSEKLNRRVEAALAYSPDAAMASAALREAQAFANSAYGNLYPSLSLELYKQRQRTSLAAQNTLGLTPVYNIYGASVNLGYQLDVSGAVRRALELEDAKVDLQYHNERASRLALAANVVIASINLASLEAQLEWQRRAWEAQQTQLDILREQLAAGSVAEAELMTARATLASARVRLSALEKQTRATRNQLATYMGQSPSDVMVEPLTLAQIQTPKGIPVTLPAKLARQRPDIQMAEALLRQASARVGIATARLYPNLTLSAAYGSQANHSARLFKDFFWNVLAGLTQPLFNAGRLRAEKKAAVAAFEGALANYRQTLLRAFQNVADTLEALQQDSEIESANQTAVLALQEALDIARARYEIGDASRVELLRVQQQQWQAQSALLAARATRLTDTAALFAALGGGFLQADNHRSDGGSFASKATPSRKPQPYLTATTSYARR